MPISKGMGMRLRTSFGLDSTSRTAAKERTHVHDPHPAEYPA